MIQGRYVIDTNTLVSRLLLRQSTPALAVHRALSTGDLLFSPATLEELGTVLRRPKFARYLEAEERESFLRLLARLAIVVHPTHTVRACRDPKDDKFLDVALHGQAQALITGDADLLALHPFRNIPILSPRQFLDSPQ